MKKSHTLALLFMGICLMLTSCASTDKAEKTADKFFSLLIKEKYAEANKLVATGFDAAQQLAEVTRMGKNDENGKLLSAKKTMGFNTQINNGVTTVTLPYALKYEKTEQNVEVTLVDQGSGLKIRQIN
jgi:hypothetical protein